MITASVRGDEDDAGPPTAEDVREKSRFIVLHSFAHAVMRALALDCGYSGSSIRERIYSSVEEGSEGLPVGVQVLAPHWRDDTVLAIMSALESHFRQQADYPHTRPL